MILLYIVAIPRDFLGNNDASIVFSRHSLLGGHGMVVAEGYV